MEKFKKITKKKKINTITLFFQNHNLKKDIIIFSRRFVAKHKKKIKIIFDNKIFDLKSRLPFGLHKERIKIKLLLLSDILYFGEILRNIELTLEYIKNNNNIFPPSIVHKFPKLVYDTKYNDEDGDDIRIFKGSFVGANYNIRILYKNKIFRIREYFPQDYMDENEEKLEIFLISLEKPDNLVEMFCQCSKLEEISITNVKDNSIIPEDRQKDLTNSINEYIEINNTENNIANSNLDERINETEKNDFYGSNDNYENLPSTILAQKNLSSINSGKALVLKYFMELNTNILEAKPLFKDIPYLIQISDISKWKPSYADSMFNGCSSLKYIPDISNWNTDNLFTIHSMFYNCKKIISLPDISKWKFRKNFYLEFRRLFFGCSSLRSIPDISNWNTEMTDSFSGVFSGCSSLNSLPDISKWKTRLIYDLSSMFENCSSLLSLPDLSKWNTRLVKDMNKMFLGCSSLISLPDLSQWNTERLEDITGLFCGCSSLLSLPDISKWTTFKLKKMSSLFRACISLHSLPNISKWFVMGVEDFSSLFYNCIGLLSLPDLSKWEPLLVKNISGLFYGCSSLVSLPDIFHWNIYLIKNMKELFAKCSSLISLPDISNWITFNIEDLYSMFSECSSLISIPDMSHWIVNNVKNMSFMFYGCTSLVSIPDISNWKTSKVTNLNHMFYGCTSLISIPDISKWNIDSVERMTDMFNGCTSLVSLPNIDKWLGNVMIQKIRVYDIFEDCESLIWIPKMNCYSKELWLSDDKNDMSQYNSYDFAHQKFY